MNIKNKKLFIKIMMVFLLLVLFFTFFSKTIYNYNLPTVTLVNPSAGELNNVVEGSSYVAYSNTWNIYGEVNGRVREILVSSGEKVKKGQPLMIVQPDTDENEVEIQASKDGVVLAIGIQKDMYIMAAQNTVLVQMAEESKEWRVDLEVDAESASQINTDSQVSLDIKDIPQQVEGKITDVASYIGNDGEEGYTISISLEYDDAIIAGKQADIVICQTSKEYSTILPNYALNKDAKGYYVLVLTEKESILGNNYVAKRISVDLLDTDSSHVAVMGINADMPIIASSTAEIEEGSRVKYEESGE